MCVNCYNSMFTTIFDIETLINFSYLANDMIDTLFHNEYFHNEQLCTNRQLVSYYDGYSMYNIQYFIRIIDCFRNNYNFDNYIGIRVYVYI